MLAVLLDLLCRFCDQSVNLAPMFLSSDRVVSSRERVAAGRRPCTHRTGCDWQCSAKPVHEPDDGPQREGEEAEDHTYIVVRAHFVVSCLGSRAALRPGEQKGPSVSSLAYAASWTIFCFFFMIAGGAK
jgi:hypothetical protein